MKIKLSAALALMAALGVKNAPNWDKDVMADRLRQVPERFAADDVPSEHAKLYSELAGLGADDTIEVIDDKEEKPAKPPGKGSAPEKKPRSRVAQPVDKFGCREGTISAKVNEVVSKSWKTDKQIAEEAGIDLRNARGRLYLATVQGLFEARRTIEYRLKPADAKN